LFLMLFIRHGCRNMLMSCCDNVADVEDDETLTSSSSVSTITTTTTTNTTTTSSTGCLPLGDVIGHQGNSVTSAARPRKKTGGGARSHAHSSLANDSSPVDMV